MRGWGGLDIGGRHSVLVVLDDNGAVLRHLDFEMTTDGQAAALAMLSGVARRRRDLLPVAVEDPNALVTRRLAEARYPVVPVSGFEASRFRAGRAPSGAKDDRSDARILADILRLQPGAHRALPRDSHEVLALRVLARQYRARRVQRNAADRQLLAQAARFYPAAHAALTRKRTRRDIHAALAIASSPTAALRVRSGTITEALRLAGRTRAPARAAADILAELRAPHPRLPVALELAHGEAFADTVALVQSIDASIETLQASLLSRAAEHDFWPVVESFPGLRLVTGAVLLAELGDDPDRFPDVRGLLAFAGVAPVTRQSGGTLTVRRRRMHGQPLALAVQDWTMPLLVNCPAARLIYDARKAAGDRHNAAARRMLSKYLRALHHCLRTAELYDERRMLPAELRRLRADGRHQEDARDRTAAVSVLVSREGVGHGPAGAP